MKPIKTRQRNSWLPQERNILAREVYAQLQKYLRYLQSSAKNTKELVSTDIIEEKPNRSGREKIIQRSFTHLWKYTVRKKRLLRRSQREIYSLFHNYLKKSSNCSPGLHGV